MRLFTTKKKKSLTPATPETNSHPWFYCTLCTHTLEYADLIDGNKCCYCKNDMFLVPWLDYEKKLNHLHLNKNI